MATSAVYAAARAYAVGFSYRDIAAEVDTIVRWATAASSHEPRSAVELAAGPAEHAIELAARGIAATALDLSPQMSAYAAATASQRGVPLTTVTADMRDFHLDDTVDLALTMIDSIAHLLTPADLDDHLCAVAAHLVSGGCYVVELSHERDSLADDTVTKSSWTQQLGDERVHVEWGNAATDSIDEATGVALVHVTLDYESPQAAPFTIREEMRLRTWRPSDIEASLQRTVAFDVVHRFGSFDEVALDANDAWRTIYVLRRR